MQTVCVFKRQGEKPEGDVISLENNKGTCYIMKEYYDIWKKEWNEQKDISIGLTEQQLKELLEKEELTELEQVIIGSELTRLQTI